MAYSQLRRNVAAFGRCLSRIFTGIANFSGRSSCADFLVFFAIFVMLLGHIIDGLGQELVGRTIHPYSDFASYALSFLAIPIFVRRLHDQNRTGWFALILPVLIGLKADAQYRFNIGLIPSPTVEFPLVVVQITCVLMFWVFVFWPGTNGENRYGPDPRQYSALQSNRQ